MISPGVRRRRGSRASRRSAAERLHALPARPLISVVMPVYETESRYLKAAIDSVRAQTYPEWELCIADDCSQRPAVRRVIEARRRADPRVKATYLERNSGISRASNAALGLCRGEHVAFLDHDDELTPDALLCAADALTADPELDIVYSDSDKLDLYGRRVDPFLKPDWAPVYALGAMYIGHLLVVRRSLVDEAGGFDPAFDKIQDFELMLRLSERTTRIRHLPRILYHWRAIPGSIAAGAEEKQGVPELQAAAVSAHLRRIGSAAIAVAHPSIPHRARLAPDPKHAANPGPGDDVSAVICWRGEPEPLERLLGSIEQAGGIRPARTIVVTGAWAPRLPELGREIEVVEDPSPTFSRARAANLGAARVRAAKLPRLLFISDAAEVAGSDWLEQLLLHLELPGVAAVGPLLVRPDGRTESAGMAIGLAEPAMPMLAGLEADADGYYGSLACARDVSALSGDCLLVAEPAFSAAGGFDEAFATGYEDFDLCQRLRRAGHGIVYAPGARVVVHEPPAARREALDMVDRALFVDRWYPELERGDPFFNGGFDREAASFTPVAAIRSAKARIR